MMPEIELQSSLVRNSKTTQKKSNPSVGVAKGRGTDVAALLSNARVLEENGERGLALNMLRVACSWASSIPAFLRHFADVLQRASLFEEELRIRARMAEISCDFESLMHKARCLQDLKREEEGMNAYYEALALLRDEDPRLFEVYKNMGNIFVRRGDFEGAEEFYNKAHLVNSESDILFVNFGTLEVQRGDFEKARQAFRRAVEINPENDKAWTGLALVHNEFGDHDLACGNIERALDLNPANRTAVHLAAHWAVRDLQPQRAIPWVQDYLADAGHDDEMSLVMIQLFCSVHRYDLARFEVERARAWAPEREDLLKIQRELATMGA